MKIITTHEAPLLKRIEYVLTMDHEKQATPKEEEVRKAASTIVKAEEACIAIKRIHDAFGSKQAQVTVYVYQDEAAKKEFEELKKKKKKQEEKKPAS